MGDGVYVIDPSGIGEVRNAVCDMTTDGGGFTQIVSWNPSAGDTLEDLTTLMTEEVNDMGLFRLLSDRLEWNDGGEGNNAPTRDAMAYKAEIDVPNGGELLYSLQYQGINLDGHGVWFYVESGTNPTPQNLDCVDHTAAPAYTASDRAWIPSYVCNNLDPLPTTQNWIWSRNEQLSVPDPVVSFHIRSLHADRGTCCELSTLSSFALWVR
ncbi:MAG: fibrinogen-like YCDxxxxGGGW domain-containing protein [Myxococcota bacterium]